ncbi:MAG: AgmX/PglI C-terminal domain-containing protein, partial [Myxococcota bacterium]
PKAVDPIEPEDEFDAPPPAPAPKAEGLATVPMEVIHVMLSNNLEVKKCFVPLFKAGTLPPRVDLKFNIMPSGSASNGQILQSQYKGGELEGCLVRAVSGITFPPTSGTGTSITYPFVLQ